MADGTSLHNFFYLIQGQGSHDISVNDFLDQIDKSMDGYLAKSVAGGVNVTLTTTEWNNRIFIFNGLLTANINVIVPITTRLFIAHNNTTGAFTLTIKTLAGTGEMVKQGTRAFLECNGTNVIQALGNGAADGTTKGLVGFTSPGFNDNGNGIISLDYTNGQEASATTTGFLKASDWIIFNNKLGASSQRVLTNNTAITIVSATIINGSMIGGMIQYHIEVTDGTDFQSEVGSIYYNAINKGGTVTVTVTESNSQQNVSAGTLTSTWNLSTTNPAVLSINANSSLTPSTNYPRITFSVQNLGQQDVAILNDMLGTLTQTQANQTSTSAGSVTILGTTNRTQANQNLVASGIVA